MSNIIRCDDVNISEIKYSKPEKVGQSYFASMGYGEKLKPLYIQTPKLKCKTNITDMKDKKVPYLDIEVPSGQMNIYNFLLSLDDNNIKTTVKHSHNWFGKEIPLEAIDDMYRRSTKPFKKNINPTIRLRLPTIKNEIQCGVYNQNRVFIGLDEIKENTDIVLIIHIRGLKILKTSYYCDCYISQIKVFQEVETKFNIISEYSMIDDDDEYDDISDIFNEEIEVSKRCGGSKRGEKKKKKEKEKEKDAEKDAEEDAGEEKDKDDEEEGEEENKINLNKEVEVFEESNELKDQIKILAEREYKLDRINQILKEIEDKKSELENMKI